jgi:hypothetical protein
MQLPRSSKTLIQRTAQRNTHVRNDTTGNKKPTPGTTFTTAQGTISLLIDTEAVQNFITMTGLRKYSQTLY